MSQLGIGAMLGHLGGNATTVEAYHKAMGREIAGAVLDPEGGRGGDGACILRFADGASLTIFDDGRSCCEHRYMACSDDLASFAGARLVSIELKPAPDLPDEYGEPHEVQFVSIDTDKGAITLETHNEHNGYYGGFWVVLEFADAAEPETQAA